MDILRDPVTIRSAPARPPALTVRDLTVSYNREPAIDSVSFEVARGESVAIIGPNGAGKSTLIKAIMGLLQPRAGRVSLAGGDGRSLGYVPQHEAVNWDFPVTVSDVVMMGCARQVGWLRWPGAAQRHLVAESLARVGLAHLADQPVGELSGGQRRRVFIARALAQQASILILDEPFSGVDTSAQDSMMYVLDSLQRDGLTILLSTHDLGLAFNRFDRVLALRGRLLAYGPPAEVYQPQVLTQLYGGRLATWENGRAVTVFVDDHGCC